MDIRLIILGSGQDGGTPQVGMHTYEGSARTASSVALIGADAPRVLFDASPDLRTQYATHLAHRYPSTRRPFDAVCITHAHMGHYTGLVHFGKEAAASSDVTLYAHTTVLDFFASNEPWASLLAGGHLAAVGTGTPLDLGAVTVSATEVPHRDEFGATVAFSISVRGEPWALYLPDIDAWDPWEDADEVIAAHRVCLIDATFGSFDELPDRDRTEMPHPPVSETIERFAGLSSDRDLILTHLNHSNPVADPDSDLHRAAVEAGFTVAYDGLEIAWAP